MTVKTFWNSPINLMSLLIFYVMLTLPNCHEKYIGPSPASKRGEWSAADLQLKLRHYSNISDIPISFLTYHLSKV